MSTHNENRRNEDFKNEDSSVPPHEEQHVVALIKQLQQQIAALEKKVDLLLSRPAQKTHEGRNFSKSYRSFGHSKRPGMTRHGDRSRERDFSAGRFDKKRGGGNRGSEQREKPFYYFDKRQGGSRRPGKKNKSFFRHKRDRPQK